MKWHIAAVVLTAISANAVQMAGDFCVVVFDQQKITAYCPQEEPWWEKKQMYGYPQEPGWTVAARDLEKYPPRSYILIEGVPRVWRVLDTGDGDFDLDVNLPNYPSTIRWGIRYGRVYLMVQGQYARGVITSKLVRHVPKDIQDAQIS